MDYANVKYECGGDVFALQSRLKAGVHLRSKTAALIGDGMRIYLLTKVIEVDSQTLTGTPSFFAGS